MKIIGSVMLLRPDGSLLLQLRDQKKGLPYAGHWSIPSGQKEAGEDIEACAKRELWEETGYRSDSLKPLAEIQDMDDTHELYSLSVFWDCYDDAQKLQCLEGQELRFILYENRNQYSTPPFIPDLWRRAIAELSVVMKNSCR